MSFAPDFLLFVLEGLLFPGVVTLIFFAFLFEWAYRKFLARFQARRGPMLAGPSGILQPFADFIKTASKEEIVPDAAHKAIFKTLPLLAPLPVLLGLFLIPVSSLAGLVNSPGDLYLLIFLLSLFAAIQITLGWASGNRFALIGASRSGLQLVSFGIPLVFAAIIPAMRAESFSLEKIVLSQTGYTGYVPNWNIFHVSGIIAFLIFLICSLAELEKVPFDTPEAETEIAGGWTLEYSGRAYAFIILSEQLKEVFMIGLAVTLFLGGPFGPTFGLPSVYHAILFTLYFLVKSLVVVFLLSLFSATMARLKVSQILEGTWSLLAPIAVLTVGLLIIIG